VDDMIMESLAVASYGHGEKQKMQQEWGRIYIKGKVILLQAQCGPEDG